MAVVGAVGLGLAIVGMRSRDSEGVTNLDHLESVRVRQRSYRRRPRSYIYELETSLRPERNASATDHRE